MDMTKALQVYLDAKRTQNLRAITLTNYAGELRKFIDHATAQGVASIEDVTPACVRGYLASCLEAGGIDTSVFQRRVCIVQWLRWLQLEEYLPAFDWQKRVPALRVDRREARCLTADECYRLQEAVEGMPSKNPIVTPRNRAILSLLVDTGLRIRECLGLKIEDIDVGECKVRVRITKGRRERIVFFGHTTAELLRRYLTLRGDSKNADCVWLWVTRSPTVRPMSYSHFSEWLKRVAERAGIKAVNCHSLRHANATLLLKRGVPVADVQWLLGHASIETTNRYIHVRAEDVRQSYEHACPMDAIAKDHTEPVRVFEGGTAC